jgi:hypothetical protein
MAIFKTPEILGSQPVPVPLYVGEVIEVTFKFDTSVTANNLASGDFIQLMQLPGDCVLTSIKLGVSATTSTATLAAGLADASATTTLATTYIAAGALTTTAVVSGTSAVMADVSVANPTADQRIVTLAIGTAAITSPIIYATVSYRNQRYGK